MRILGLDTGTKTGWCVYDSENGVIESGVQDFSKKRGESNGLMFLRFRKWMQYILDIQDIQLVGYERAHFRGGAATEIGVGLQTRVQEECAGHDPVIEAAPVHTGTLKKWACGHGKASKEDMARKAIQYLKQLQGTIGYDEADAILIAAWTAKEYT